MTPKNTDNRGVKRPSEASTSLDPTPDPQTSKAAKSRISTLAKSGLCKALKWAVLEDRFVIRVPAQPETKALTDWLWSIKDPSAQYSHPQRGVVAWHWTLDMASHRALYHSVKGTP